MAKVYITRDTWYGVVVQDEELLKAFGDNYLEMMYANHSIVDLPDDLYKEYTVALKALCEAERKIKPYIPQ